MTNEIITVGRPLVVSGGMIRTLRERAGLTQEALAKKIEVVLRTIQRWEAGDTKPTDPQQLRRLVTVLAPEIAIPQEQVPVVFEDIQAVRADIRRILKLVPLIQGKVNKPVVLEIDDLLGGILSTLKFWELGEDVLRNSGIFWYQDLDGTPVVWVVVNNI